MTIGERAFVHFPVVVAGAFGVVPWAPGLGAVAAPGAYHGAMSYYALQAIREAPQALTYNRLHSRITSLIGDYPQHPQLEGSNANKRRQLFT